MLANKVVSMVCWNTCLLLLKLRRLSVMPAGPWLCWGL
jgi:hypothetical protein